MKRNKVSITRQPVRSKMKANENCRICFSNSSYRDIYNDYFYCGKLENYGQMLDNTFNICTLKSKKTLICDECINKLRDATEFKQKILSSDEFLSGLVDDAKEKYNSDLELDSNSGIDSELDIKDKPVYKNTQENADAEMNTILFEPIKAEVKQEHDNFELPSNKNDDENDPFYDEKLDNQFKMKNGENNRNKVESCNCN